jgi:hypothetical protein
MFGNPAFYLCQKGSNVATPNYTKLFVANLPIATKYTKSRHSIDLGEGFGNKPKPKP